MKSSVLLGIVSSILILPNGIAFASGPVLVSLLVTEKAFEPPTIDVKVGSGIIVCAGDCDSV
jgi:hypothetical protein